MDFLTQLTTQNPYISAGLIVVGALVTIASAIVPFTKTTKDDEILSKVKDLLARFSIFEPKK